MSSETIAKGLGEVLANSYTLYLKTQNFHWNVTGPMFQSLHALFMAEYTELSLAVDTLAERIRALGYFAPGSFEEYLRLSTVKSSLAVPSAEEMVQQLAADQDTLLGLCKPVFDAASASGDDVTADLMVQRMDVHAKNAWMLRSMLPGGQAKTLSY